MFYLPFDPGRPVEDFVSAEGCVIVRLVQASMSLISWVLEYFIIHDKLLALAIGVFL